MVSVDLQGAYLQVPVHPESCRYLRFCSSTMTFQFRVVGPSGLHLGHGSSLCHSPLEGFLSSALPRRLASAGSFPSRDLRAKDFFLTVSLSWHCYQREEKLSYSNAGEGLSRVGDSLGSFEGFSRLPFGSSVSCILDDFLSSSGS